MNGRVTIAAIAPGVVGMSAMLLGSTCAPTATSSPVSVRFRLAASSDVRAPVYVQVVGEDGQPGWVRVTRLGERVYLRERCEVPDCGSPPAVCGAAVPVVRDIAAGAARRTIDIEWDGAMSVLDPGTACENRRAAPTGDYVATFCYSRQADLQGTAGAGADVQGVLRQPTCRDVLFSLPSEADVELSITSGSF